MKRILSLFIPLLLLTSLTGCNNQEKESLKCIVSKSPFNMDRDGKSDALVFRSDMTFDYTKVSDYYLNFDSVKNGKYECVNSYTYSWEGNWGYKGKSKVTIYQLLDLSFTRESDEGTKTINFYFVDQDGLYYSYSREYMPEQSDIKNGLTGVRWYPQKSN